MKSYVSMFKIVRMLLTCHIYFQVKLLLCYLRSPWSIHIFLKLFCSRTEDLQLCPHATQWEKPVKPKKRGGGQKTPDLAAYDLLLLYFNH